MERRQKFVADLANKNRDFYGSKSGQSALRMIDFAFDLRWAYMYEIVQNSLDVGAKSISIKTGEDGDALIIQHDGDRPLDEKDVTSLSTIFQSTKGACSVGFMGIGFKSVFTRFDEVRVSGWGWKFRYEVTREVGAQYKDVQRNFLGTVIPIWDDKISPPENRYTTRFELRNRADDSITIKSDLAQFLPENDRASLAILAMSGIERLEIDGQIWEIGISEDRDGTFEATALSETDNHLWRVFRKEFQPSAKAIRCFLEHRKIQPAEGKRKQVYNDAARTRHVLGVLPLDNDGNAAPPQRGRVYATLPTEVTLPFGLHISADWLLNLSRSGLREIEENAWQREIAESIADILVHYLEWSTNAHRNRDAAKATFNAIREPSSENGGLETLFVKENWRSRLREKLQAAAVIPVWTESADGLAYAKPCDVIVPPEPIRKALEHRPELRPATLLNGPVLMHEVIGPPAHSLLQSIGVLTEMSPKKLENVWKDGLEDWFSSLTKDESDRRMLIFRLWAAVAELSNLDEWANLHIRCVRSVTGSWVTVDEATFLNEALATENEPGGKQTRKLMEKVVPKSNLLDWNWITALRQTRPKNAEFPYVEQAWGWIKDHACSLGLLEVVKNALATQMSSTITDRSVLISFGHWAKSRNRHDLLPYVLVHTDAKEQLIPIEEALLAAPYTKAGPDRQRLWNGVSVIHGAYLEKDLNNGSAQEWHKFFESAGAKGKLKVQPSVRDVARSEREIVAEFLGQDSSSIPYSNKYGYSLLDFDIQPELPTRESSTELRAAVGPLLEDDFKVLKGTGCRKISYFYYDRKEQPGKRLSAWVLKLCDLPWVPCNDGELREPRAALREPDPARQDAPFARLSSELLDMLKQEGVEFGTAIPKAKSLQKLMSLGSDLNAKKLAKLIADCREDATTHTERKLFSQYLTSLKLPTTKNRRVKLDRIVRKTGGKLRGLLGDWIVRFDQIDEALRNELTHKDFPHKFPETTTGEQALDYVVDVWKRAQSSPGGLANEVREVLPTAYAYILEDVCKNAALLERWNEELPRAVVFSEKREWIALNYVEDVYFDNIEDRRFFPTEAKFTAVTAGHLGRNRSEQLCTAEAIGLLLLSSVVEMSWNVSDRESPTSTAYEAKFDLIWDLLQSVKLSGPFQSGEADAESKVRLFHTKEIALDVSIDGSPPERVPVHARLHEGTLTVAGRPVQFGADAAKEILRLFSFGQRADLAADLTGMFSAIESDDFKLAAEKFRRSHAPAYIGSIGDGARVAGSDVKLDVVVEDSVPRAEPEPNGNSQRPGSPNSGTTEQFSCASPGGETVENAPSENHDGPHNEHNRPFHGSYVKDRAMAKQNALARDLKKSLKGEILPSSEMVEQLAAVPANGDSGNGLGDEKYREVVLRYEKDAGRTPELAGPHQSGWDIRSVDPQTGNVRLIEVKGKGRLWDADEVVELSGAQVRKAFEAAEGWYLYVVEKVDECSYRVLPIENPARNASKWILCGKSWRMIAENVKVFQETTD